MDAPIGLQISKASWYKRIFRPLIWIRKNYCSSEHLHLHLPYLLYILLQPGYRHWICKFALKEWFFWCLLYSSMCLKQLLHKRQANIARRKRNVTCKIELILILNFQPHLPHLYVAFYSMALLKIIYCNLALRCFVGIWMKKESWIHVLFNFYIVRIMPRELQHVKNFRILHDKLKHLKIFH